MVRAGPRLAVEKQAGEHLLADVKTDGVPAPLCRANPFLGGDRRRPRRAARDDADALDRDVGRVDRAGDAAEFDGLRPGGRVHGVAGVGAGSLGHDLAAIVGYGRARRVAGEIKTQAEHRYATPLFAARAAAAARPRS